MYPRFLRKVFSWAKARGYCSIESEKRGELIWLFIGCWVNSQFRWVCVSILDRFSSNVKGEVVVLGRIIDALGSNVHVISVHGAPHALVKAYVNFLGSGFQQKLIEHPLFHFCLPNDAFKGLRQVSLGFWTPTRWRSSLWRSRRGQRVVIG